MCTAHLNMHNIEVPNNLNNQRIAVLNHKESLSRNSNNHKNIKFESLIRSSYMLAAQIMTSDEKNAENIKIYIKLYLNELHAKDILYKKITNNDNKIPMWLSQYNNLNLLYCLPRDMIRNGNVGNYWDGKEHGEKGMQPVKNEFVTKKGNFAGKIMETLHSKKVMNYLTDDINNGSSEECNITTCVVKSPDFLSAMIKQGTPTPFVGNEMKECLFLTKNQDAQQFFFENYIGTIMCLNYFSISYGKLTNEPLCLTKYGKTQKCVLLATKINDNDNYYYTAISNNWHTLNKVGELEIIHYFDCSN